MIISEKMKNELLELQQESSSILDSNSLTNTQLEAFTKKIEKHRYNILNEIRMYNQNVDFEYEKIKTIDNEYKARLTDDVLEIYVPEVMPSYKYKTHAYKRILLNIAEVTKPFANQFKTEVFIYIKIFDDITQGWDIDNKYIKPIADALILSKTIQDDNITKMYYCAKGEYSETPHTEIYVFDSKEINKFLEKYTCKKYGF